MLNQMYEQYCANRLPCGICRLTNSQCPKCGVTINTTPTFDFCKVMCTSAPAVNPNKDSVTYSAIRTPYTNTTEVNS